MECWIDTPTGLYDNHLDGRTFALLAEVLQRAYGDRLQFLATSIGLGDDLPAGSSVAQSQELLIRVLDRNLGRVLLATALSDKSIEAYHGYMVLLLPRLLRVPLIGTAIADSNIHDRVFSKIVDMWSSRDCPDLDIVDTDLGWAYGRVEPICQTSRSLRGYFGLLLNASPVDLLELFSDYPAPTRFPVQNYDDHGSLEMNLLSSLYDLAEKPDGAQALAGWLRRVVDNADEVFRKLGDRRLLSIMHRHLLSGVAHRASSKDRRRRYTQDFAISIRRQCSRGLYLCAFELSRGTGPVRITDERECTLDDLSEVLWDIVQHIERRRGMVRARPNLFFFFDFSDKELFSLLREQPPEVWEWRYYLENSSMYCPLARDYNIARSPLALPTPPGMQEATREDSLQRKWRSLTRAAKGCRFRLCSDYEGLTEPNGEIGVFVRSGDDAGDLFVKFVSNFSSAVFAIEDVPNPGTASMKQLEMLIHIGVPAILWPLNADSRIEHDGLQRTIDGWCQDSPVRMLPELVHRHRNGSDDLCAKMVLIWRDPRYALKGAFRKKGEP